MSNQAASAGPSGLIHARRESRYVLPSFVERTSYGVKEMNPYNKLFEERIIFLGVQIDDASANDVMAQLITLESIDPEPGHPDLHQLARRVDDLDDGDLRHDAVHPAGYPDLLPRPGRLGGGRAAGGRDEGQAVRAAERADPDPPARRGERLRAVQRPGDPGPRDPADAVRDGEIILASHTGQSEDQVRKDIERDKFFTAHEAKEYGLVDEVLTMLKRKSEVGSS